MSSNRETEGPAADDISDDETIVVALPALDETILVAKPEVEDATIVVAQRDLAQRDVAQKDVAQPVSDETVVVLQKNVFQKATAQPVSDETIVVAKAAAAQKDVAQPFVSDETVVVARNDPDATMVSVRPSNRDPAPPVAEPDAELSERALAKLLFKSPLDPRRRAKESPFPQPEHTLPKRGVSQSMPVVYGTRSEDFSVQPAGLLDLERRIGAPPTTPPPPAVLRDDLPSAAQLNRKFRLVALLGGAGVIVVVGLGLWGIAALAFG